MDENYNELTFRDIWYKYLIPFFKWFGRSVKRTFTSKRVIAAVAVTVIVPLIAWGVFEIQTKKEIEADTLLKSEAKFLLNVDYSKISVPVDDNAEPKVSRESYALTVAREQVAKYADVVTGENILNQLYENDDIKTNAGCLLKNLDSKFENLYYGKKSENGVITKEYFVWAIGNYLDVKNRGSGVFSVELISNRARNYSDFLDAKATPKNPTTVYENNQLNIRKFWPLLSSEFMNAINAALPGIILNKDTGLLSLMDTVTEIEDEGGIIKQIDFVKNLQLISSPITYVVSNPNFIADTEFTYKNWISWTIGGFFIGIGLFLVIDMVIAIVEGDRRYRGIVADVKITKEETPPKAQE